MMTKEQTEDFVKALTLAWKRLGLYPPNHPARRGAMDPPCTLLRGLLQVEDPVSLAATEDALIVRDERLDSLPAIELAKALYEHNVGVLRFSGAVSTVSLEAFSSRLRATDRQPGSSLIEEFGSPSLQENGIEVEQVDYSSLVAHLEKAEAQEPVRQSLLERLLALQLDQKSFIDQDTSTDFQHFLAGLRHHLATLREQSALLGSVGDDFKEQLTKALEEHLIEGIAAGFHVVDLDHLKRLFDELPRELRIDVLSQLLGSLFAIDGDAAVAALESTNRPEELLSAVRRLRRQGVPFSSKAQRMAEQLLGQIQGQQEPAEFHYALAEYGRLVQGQLDQIAPATLDDPAYLILRPLDPSSGAAPHTADPSVLERMLDDLAPEQQRQTVLTSLLELIDRDASGHRLPPEHLEAILARLASTFHALVVTGHANAASAVIHFLQERYGQGLQANNPVVATALRDFGGKRATASVLEAVSLSSSSDDYGALHELVRAAPDGVAGLLVEQLSDCDDRRTRRRLFDFLVPLKPLVLTQVQALLARSEWFHVRNGISLLDTMADTASIPKVRSLSQAEEVAVRDAAVRFLLRHDTLIPVDLITDWLSSEDTQFARRTIQLVGRSRQWNAVEPLMELLTGVDTFRRKREERAAAILALAQIAEPDSAVRLAEQFESNLRLQHPDEKRLFYESLVHYKPEDRRSVLERGRTSRDAAIRHVCEQMLGGEASP